MKIYMWSLALCALMHGTCFADLTEAADDVPDNIEFRVAIASASVKAAQYVLARIQEVAHSDPNEVCDLACTAHKFLINAENALDHSREGVCLPDICR